ncbi:hypothetical protein MPTK1_4g07870 [Marchantia polymorpha subsp. ruderalis]|uniref:Uncharacterized protein n=2 Tax=Marchantia polymorpha TaxID=3197 RepID=A0AAF6B7K4_MARPO|nr:hypothetical protein MARPO_0120s0054 [Marchantia polymorpha]BBN07988.1 hypothetical protein Mp_4g07870 [Marchantia polymorpha subsp. ruderalis]|eukprot:PTQ30782.1 hypothetical protein MARPO_0120s0054 [Marchantia polymorpha]
MTSIGCLSDSPCLCLSSSGHIDQIRSHPSSRIHWNSSPSTCNFGRARSVLAVASFTGRGVALSGNVWKNVTGGKTYAVRLAGAGITRASRADSTLNAEATDRKSSEQPATGSSAETHLDLLERFISESSKDGGGRTIAEQLEEQVDLDQAEIVTVPLAQSMTLEQAPLTISQKRNIRRQKYLDEVAKRNDAPFFTTVALFVILPPAVILGVAVATGYINILP